MLLALGIGSQIGILEGMLCTIFDIDILKRIKKQYITGKLIDIDNVCKIINHINSEYSFV